MDGIFLQKSFEPTKSVLILFLTYLQKLSQKIKSLMDDLKLSMLKPLILARLFIIYFITLFCWRRGIALNDEATQYIRQSGIVETSQLLKPRSRIPSSYNLSDANNIFHFIQVNSIDKRFQISTFQSLIPRKEQLIWKLFYTMNSI